MAISTKLIEELVGKTRVGFRNAKRIDEIKQEILGYGFDDVRIQSGIDMGKSITKLTGEQKELYGNQYIATQKVKERLEKEQLYYMDIRKLARKTFKYNKEVQKKLGIDVELETNLESFMVQGRLLYEGALNDPEILAGLGKFNITAEKLQAGLDGLAGLEQLDEEQEELKGAAQRATKLRDDLYHQLLDLWGEFVQVCQIALRDKPQLREKLGLLERS